MVTNKKAPTQRTRRAAAPKPVIDPNVKPSVEDFDPIIHVAFRLVNVAGTPTIQRKSAEKPMVLSTGVIQPTDADGNVVRTTPNVTRGVKDHSSEGYRLMVESTVELLRLFPDAKSSWVAALRTARWTRKQNIMRADGTPFLSCDRLQWGTNGQRGAFHDALDIVNAVPAKKTVAKRAPKPTTAKRAAKKTA